MEYLGYIASIVIGITLGVIGGGGSILTVPILVYLFGIDPDKATSYSLFIVGATALVGSYRHFKLGNLILKPALFFTASSIASLLLVRNLILPIIPDSLFFIGTTEITKAVLIMTVFAILMIAASFSMIRKSDAIDQKGSVDLARLTVVGFIVGIVTGFLGAGGGFLIIPALLFFGNLPMKQAVGTSLVIIAVNSLIGFGGDVIAGVALDFTLLIAVTAIAIVGMFIGTMLSKKIDGAKLKPAFGWFVLAMGAFILVSEIFLK